MKNLVNDILWAFSEDFGWMALEEWVTMQAEPPNKTRPEGRVLDLGRSPLRSGLVS